MPSISERYQQAFARRLRQLLAWGYKSALTRIRPNEEEDTITQYIKEEIETITQDAFENANSPFPAWCKNFVADDQVPISGTPRLGKRRLKADLRITFFNDTQRHKNFVFFEAKRLYEHCGASVYTGKEGMGCFLDGLYPAHSQKAYMLGYVQNKNISAWKKGIQKKLHKNKEQLGFLKTQNNAVHNTLLQEWASLHKKKPVGKITIYHILLDCTCQ